MPTIRTIRPLGSAALVAFVVTAALAATPAAPGVSFLMRTTSGAGGGAGSPSVNRVRVQGESMRFDSEGSPAASGDATAGGYTLLDGAGRRVVVVMPERKQYMEIRFDDTTTQALMTAAAVSATTVTDVKVRGESLGGGEAVNGMPTRRYRLTTDYTYRDGSAPAAPTGTMRVVESYWVSDKLAGVADPLEQLGRTLGGRGGFGASPFATVSATSVGALLERRAAEQRRLFKGMPARTVTVTTDVKPGGERSEQTTTTEISDVVRGDLDAALFRVPDGYTKFDMKQLLNVSAQMKAALRGKADAAGTAAADTTSMLDAAKDGAKEGAKEGLREGAREAAGRKVRGIFKRP